jgi:hypothetical protein
MNNMELGACGHNGFGSGDHHCWSSICLRLCGTLDGEANGRKREAIPEKHRG